MDRPAMPAILLVEDEAIVARDLQESLLELGYDVFAIADSAGAALEHASRQRPDIVLMDIRIKGPVDGIQTARILQREFRCAIIYLTAHADDDTIQLAKQTEPYGYLLKPVKTAELRAMIETALYRRERDEARDRVAHLDARVSALTDLNLQLASERDPRVLLEKVCRRARTMFGAAYAVLGVSEKLTNSLFFCTAGLEHDAPATVPRLDFGPLGAVYRRSTPWRALLDPHDPSDAEVLPPGYPAVRAYLAVPITSLTRTYGWLCLAGKPGAEQFTAEDEQVLCILTGQVGRIYENGSLYQDLQLHAAKLQREVDERKLAEEKIQHLNRVYAVLSGINGLIVRAQTQTGLCKDACRLAVEQGDFQLAWIGWLQAGQRDILPLAWAGAQVADGLLCENVAVAIGAEVLATIQRVQPWVCNDLAAAAPMEPHLRELLARGLRSVVTLPLVVDKQTVGCLTLATDECESFDAPEMRLLIELAADISFTLDYLEKAQKLAYLAFYDSLTGLANRTLFLERLAQLVNAAKRSDERFAVVVRDPERFDTINQTFGRTQGDVLLKEIADRLVEVSGDRNSVARIGSDQFALVLPFSGDVGAVARALQDQYQAWLGSPFEIGGEQIAMTARAGIAIYPDDATDAESLLRNAEAALRRSSSPGDRHVFFTKQISDRIAARLSLESRLRHALANREFELHYQPKVDARTREIVGFEALIRWRSPELGLVQPADFIPLMEETGMIIDVGTWVMLQACIDRGTWLEQELPAPRIAVNVSSVQLRQPDFVEVVRSTLKRGIRSEVIFGSAEAGMDIEVTETLFVESAEANIEKVRAVRALGVQVAIDDFGTGYSSLGYLAKMPLDGLKIDRSFIAAMLEDPSAMTLVSTMITLAHSLSFTVIAEGVESEDQARILRLLRCDQMQGYLISKPLPFDAITALLQSSKNSAEARERRERT